MPGAAGDSGGPRRPRAPLLLRVGFGVGVAALALGMLVGALHSLRVDGRLPLLGLNYTRFLRALEARREHAELEREWRVVAAIDPASRSIAHQSLGALYAEQGRIDAALREFELALALRPDDAAAHTNLAILLAQQQRTAEALAQLDAALELRPRFEAALALREELLRAPAQPARDPRSQTPRRNPSVSRAQRSQE